MEFTTGPVFAFSAGQIADSKKEIPDWNENGTRQTPIIPLIMF
jgi:hypothetical protein